MINDEKPNIQTGLTCPVKECVSVCDLVVMQVDRGWHERGMCVSQQHVYARVQPGPGPGVRCLCCAVVFWSMPG